MPRDRQCARCTLSRTTPQVCIWGRGEPGGIMFVGEAPGALEEEQGVPFIGPAGQLLSSLIRMLETDVPVYITNAVRCRPPGNRTPSKKEVAACSGYLAEEIREARPRVVVALGATALTALTGLTGVAANRSKALNASPILRPVLGDVPVVATYHPAAYLRGRDPTMLAQIAADLKLAVSLLDAPDRERPYTYVQAGPYGLGDPTEAVAALEAIATYSPWVAVDLEWRAGVDHLLWPWSRGAEPFTLAAAGLDETGRLIAVAVSIPFEPGIRDALQHLLSSTDVILHNATADMVWLVELGFTGVRLRVDTLVLARLLDPADSASLEAVTGRYAPDSVFPGWKGHLAYHRPPGPAEWAELLQYNADDAAATALAYQGMLRGLSLMGTGADIARLHDELMLPALQPLITAAYVGLPLDGQKLSSSLDEAREGEARACETLAGVTGLSPRDARKLARSPERTAQFLEPYFDEPLPNTQAATLALYAGAIPAIPAILNVRAYEKLIGTYLEPWARLLAEQGHDRLHTLYRPVGARTGRLSGEAEMGGSLLTMPRNSDLLRFRELVRARPGWQITAADYSQIELRVLAWLAHEEVMLSLLRDGEDLHRATAAFVAVQPMPLEEFWPRRKEFMALVTPPQRQGAKGVNFGFAFGMEEELFLTYARVNYGVRMTLDEAFAARRGYFDLYPGLLPFHRQQRAIALRGEPTVTPFGRRRLFGEENANAAINTPVQSTASDLTLLALVQFDRARRARGMAALPVGIVHDAILVETPDEEVEAVEALLRETMEGVDTSPWGFSVPVPLVADVHSGESWG